MSMSKYRLIEIERDWGLEDLRNQPRFRLTMSQLDVLDLVDEVKKLRELIHEHYPTIAGQVIRLNEGHEFVAANEWNAVAKDFAAVLN